MNAVDTRSLEAHQAAFVAERAPFYDIYLCDGAFAGCTIGRGVFTESRPRRQTVTLEKMTIIIREVEGALVPGRAA